MLAWIMKGFSIKRGYSMSWHRSIFYGNIMTVPGTTKTGLRCGQTPIESIPLEAWQAISHNVGTTPRFQDSEQRGHRPNDGCGK